jgi:hypothetical protein
MPGLDPGIHVFGRHGKKGVDGRVKPGHDEENQIPKYRCCKSGSAINSSDVPLHTVRPRSMM